MTAAAVEWYFDVNINILETNEMEEFVTEYSCVFVLSWQAVNRVGKCFLNLTPPRVIWKERTLNEKMPSIDGFVGKSGQNFLD